MHIMQPPPQSRDSDSSGNYTRCNMQHWPPIEKRHIAWLGEVLSCKRIDIQDKRGFNILHHVCKHSSSCPLMLYIIRMLTNDDMPTLEGSFRTAVEQCTKHTTPNHWTPLHFLCQNADKDQQKASVVKALLDKKLVLPTDFDVRNDRVYVSFSFLKGLTPSPPSAASSQVTDGDQASRQVPNTLLGSCTFNYICLLYTSPSPRDS